MNYLKDLREINEQQRDKLINALKVGTPENVACAYANIKPVYLRHLIWVSKEIIKIKDYLVYKGYKTVKELTKQDIIDNNLNVEIAREMLKTYNYGKVATDFYYELQQAKSECIVYHLNKLRQGKGNCLASTWYLERTLPEYFARKDNYTNKDDDKVEQIKVVYVDSKSDEKERIEELTKEVEGAINVRN